MNVFKLRRYPWDMGPELCNNSLTPTVYTGGEEILVTKITEIKTKSKDYSFNHPIEYEDAMGNLFKLYDIPFAAVNKNNDIDLFFSLSSRSNDGKYDSRQFQLRLSKVASKNAANERIIDLWASFFAELSIIAEESGFAAGEIPYENLLSLVSQVEGNKDQPIYSLIVRISDDLSKKIPNIIAGLRKILLAKRQMLPVNRISELDPACLRWIVRQPGETIYEKASSNKFQLKGIAREEQFDLLENRVLKDFLYRCVSKSNDYIEEFGNYFKGSLRIRQIKMFRELCLDALHQPVLANVARQETIPTPNYVLQNDGRYKTIWKYYLRLLRAEKLKDKLWFQQKNTFKDIALMLLQVAECSLLDGDAASGSISQFSAIGNTTIKIFREQMEGSIIEANSMPGPFVMEKNGEGYILENVRPLDIESIKLYPEIKPILCLSASSYILVKSLNNPNKELWILVFIIHSACCTSPLDMKKIAASCKQNLAIASVSFPRKYDLVPLIFCSVPGNWDESIAINNEEGAVLKTINVNPKKWGEEITSIKQSLIRLFEDYV